MNGHAGGRAQPARSRPLRRARPAPPSSLPGVSVLVGLAAAVVVAAGLRAVAWLVWPVVLALVIVITARPLHTRWRARGMPSWLATALLVALVYGALIALAAVLVVSLTQLAATLPRYADEATALADSATRVLADLGVDPDQLRVMAQSADYGQAMGVVTGFVRGTTSLLSNLVLLLTLLLFLGIETSGASQRLAVVAESRPHLAAALSDFARSTRRYAGVTTLFGLATGLVDAVLLALLGVPLAVLWGLLVFITNYLPYVGFWIGLVPPTLLALLDGGWQLAVVVAVLYTVVNFVLTSVLEPKYVGDAVDLSVTVTLISLVFWAWLLGPLGAVLAVPLTLLARALLLGLAPGAAWADAALRSGHTITARAAGGRPPRRRPRPRPPNAASSGAPAR